jgi:hypothetical protein
MVGIGIRLAQDVGAHRRKIYNRKPTVEDELWKRAFWWVSTCKSPNTSSQLDVFLAVLSFFMNDRLLVCIDRIISSGLGRPCALQDEE